MTSTSVSNNLSGQRYSKLTSILMSIHTWRIGGIVFLWGVSRGILDPAFGYPAGIGDILIGISTDST